MGVDRCSVPLCSSRRDKCKGLSFHEFPCDEKMRTLWLKNISREVNPDNSELWSPNDRSYVCGLHFDPSSYLRGGTRKVLKKCAVPTLFLDFPALHLQSKIKPSATKRKRMTTPLNQNKHDCVDMESDSVDIKEEPGLNTGSKISTESKFVTSIKPMPASKVKKIIMDGSKTIQPEDTEQKYECGICDSTFPSVELRHKHTEESHCRLRNPSCKKCGHVFGTQASLYTHFNIHSFDWKEKPYKCEICPSGFTCKSVLAKHNRIIHQNKSNKSSKRGKPQQLKPRVKCGVCSQKFSSIELLGEHMRNVHHSLYTVEIRHQYPSSEHIYECGICFQSFPTHNLRHEHNILEHKTEENIYPCKYCGTEVKSFQDLYAHLLKHTRSKKKYFKCKIRRCGREFSKQSKIERHIKYDHGDEQQPDKPKKVKKTHGWRPFGYRKKTGKKTHNWKDLGISGNNLNGSTTATVETESRLRQNFQIKIEESENESMLNPNPISSLVHVIIPVSNIKNPAQGFGEIEEVDTNVFEPNHMSDPFADVASEIPMIHSLGTALPVPTLSSSIENDDPDIDIKPEVGELFMGRSLKEGENFEEMLMNQNDFILTPEGHEQPDIKYITTPQHGQPVSNDSVVPNQQTFMNLFFLHRKK